MNRGSRWGLSKSRRHRCNGCRTIFDCDPCRHRSPGPVFCTPECEKRSIDSTTFTRPIGGRVAENYLKRALGIKGKGT
jgi:hypothetical protein